LICDILGRVLIAPYELPIELIVGIFGSILFIGLLLYRLRNNRKAITWENLKTSLKELKGGVTY
jgi:iron complex transport system permease protein